MIWYNRNNEFSSPPVVGKDSSIFLNYIFLKRKVKMLEKLKNLEKIGEPEPICLDPEHDPPGSIVLDPGKYKYTCPSCGKESVFEIPQIIA